MGLLLRSWSRLLPWPYSGATEGGCRVLQLCSKILCLKIIRSASLHHRSSGRSFYAYACSTADIHREHTKLQHVSSKSPDMRFMPALEQVCGAALRTTTFKPLS